MSDSRDTQNKIVLTISGIRNNPAAPWVKRIIISVQNSLDDTDTFNNNNSEDIPNYLESSELQQILKNISMHLQHAYHVQGVDIVEGDEPDV